MASVRLTALGVERLRPDPAKRLEIADGKLAGLYFVVQPSGRSHGRCVAGLTASR